jgi:hypothetical protein
VVSRGYKGIVENAKINEQGLVDIYSACEGLCVQANYDAYINYPKSVNGNEAVAGFLWAMAASRNVRNSPVGRRGRSSVASDGHAKVARFAWAGRLAGASPSRVTPLSAWLPLRHSARVPGWRQPCNN